MDPLCYLEAGRRVSWDAVQVAHPVINTQRSGRLGNQLYASLESAGRDPTVPLPSHCVTFPLEASVNTSSVRGHPRLQAVVPDEPWLTPLSTGHQRGFHAGGNEEFQPRDWELGVSDISRSIPAEQSNESAQHTWLDQQESWLDWAEISFPQAGQLSSDQPEEEFNLNVALSGADPAIPDLDSTLYSAHQEQARWGSDPAFKNEVFTPPSDQLSETEVTSIWKDYVVVSLKPVVNMLGYNMPVNQPLIVGNNEHDVEFNAAEPHNIAVAHTLPISFSDSKRLKHIDDFTPPTAIAQREPLPPFPAGRKRPMPPRIERISGYCS